MKMMMRFGGVLLALVLFGLTYAGGTEPIRTRDAFKRTQKGLAVVLVYTLDPADQKEAELPDGKIGHTPAWQMINRADEMIGRLGDEEDYDIELKLFRVNFARGDLSVLREKYKITGTAILLFVNGKMVGKPIPVGPDFKLSMLKKTNAWLTFDDFVQQRIADRKQAERQKAQRDRERRRTYDYYYGPRPYLSVGWGDYYGGPGGWGWGAPYVGFGFSI
jgi:hypothetical protein